MEGSILTRKLANMLSYEEVNVPRDLFSHISLLGLGEATLRSVACFDRSALGEMLLAQMMDQGFALQSQIYRSTCMILVAASHSNFNLAPPARQLYNLPQVRLPTYNAGSRLS
jgi:hypothetical protein